MDVRPLRNDLIDAGARFLETLDQLDVGVNGAAWLYFHRLGDWRFFVATPLVDTMGRKSVYSLLADALDVTGTPDGMTLFDIHLESPTGSLFGALSVVRVEGDSRAFFEKCNLNGVPVDGLFYRMTTAEQTARPKLVEANFKKTVKKVVADAE